MYNSIEQIYKNRQNFIIIGLTGKIGAGCTTCADFLTKDKETHNLKNRALSDNPTDKERKKYIIHNFYSKNWSPFIKIVASDIITSFLLENSFDDVQTFLSSNGNTKLPEDFRKAYSLLYERHKDIAIQDKKSKKELGDKTLYEYIVKELPEVSEKIKSNLGIDGNYKNYSKAFQKLGDNIRLYGSITDSGEMNPENIYSISERINFFIKVIGNQHKKENKPTYIVIDAFRNPFEIMFFKERYSAFYLMSINAEDNDIIDRLTKKKELTPKEIEDIHKKEEPRESVQSFEKFVSQNVQVCIQKSDIHVNNKGDSENTRFHELYGQLIKYICLIQHPGIITPSLDEKMMQVAYTAKLNSACLSRQVGASITNQYGSLKAIGWNSVADGQTPCLLRDKNELLQNTESVSYSKYEKSPEFQGAIEKYYPKIKKDVLKGRNESFCFKSIYNNHTGKDNQVHTRSLHAEENAFLQLAKYGNESIQGGTLYSTASPCELCSKKAYQLGISRIVYIDPYPGIAQNQILHTGLNPPEKIELFTGAIGTAYHKVFDPILSYKDELSALSKEQ